MRVFVAGASGAIGTRLVPQLIDAGHEVIGTYRSPESAERVRALGADAGRARPARRARGAQGRARAPRPTRSSTRRPPWPNAQFAPQLRPQLRADQPAADRGHRRPAGRRARGGRAPVRRPELRQLPLRARGRPGQDRGRPARPDAGRRRRARADAAMRHLDEAVTDAGGIVLRYGGFYGAANDGLIEPVRKRQFPIVGDGGGVVLVHPPRRRRRGDRARARARRPGDLQHRRRRPRPGARVAARARPDALGAKPPRHFPRWLARLFAGEAAVDDGHRVARRLEREGQARARLDAPLPELVVGVEAGEERGAGRSAGRGLRVVAAKQRALRGQTVDMRGPEARVADRRDAIGAPLVERDQEDVGTDVRHRALSWRNGSRRKRAGAPTGLPGAAAQRGGGIRLGVAARFRRHLDDEIGRRIDQVHVAQIRRETHRLAGLLGVGGVDAR